MFFNISKSFSPTRIRQVGRVFASQPREVVRGYDVCCWKNVLGGSVNGGLPLQRCYSIDTKEDPASENVLPPLVGNDLIIVPGIFKTISSIFQLQGHLRRYDPSFQVPEFVEASKQAVETVSHFLSKENYEALEGLVTPEVIQQLRQKICTLTPSQKELIAIRKEDIYGQFPYTMNMLYEGEGDNKKAYAEILMVYYSLRGLAEMREKNINPPLQMGLMPEYRDKIFLANYRFIKDYTNGNDEPWIVNLCNEVMLLAYK
ncbi:uncharacterized protein LOC107045115 [Diachasma alloeum]|uniref:uncharacterized protein LOC107045115 n=1 Tax=Diachasma alloeum TaxID=454923 RepID=UPI0007384F29|nr:uncharacterized protein LOC107045115 [Diachasma alloeum]